LKTKNYWGDPDDEPLPDWMNPETYRHGNKKVKATRTLEEAAAEALKKPPIPIILKDPTK
jgi:hypothetical protein